MKKIIILLPGDIQMNNQCPSCKVDFSLKIEAAPTASTPAQGENTEKREALLTLLSQQMRDVERLVRAQAICIPILSRTYNTQLEDSLLYQTEVLLSMLSTHVLPFLGQTYEGKS